VGPSGGLEHRLRRFLRPSPSFGAAEFLVAILRIYCSDRGWSCKSLTTGTVDRPWNLPRVYLNGYVPEPSTLALAFLGAAMLVFRPKPAGQRCERHKATEHRTANDPVKTPASNATQALVCLANFPRNVRSRSQQAAVTQTKYPTTVDAVTCQIRCKVILPSWCNDEDHRPGASHVRPGTEAPSPGSVRPSCSAMNSFLGLTVALRGSETVSYPAQWSGL